MIGCNLRGKSPNIRVMRFVLTLLAVLAMLAGPVAASAAQVACDGAATKPMAGMDTPAANVTHVNVDKTTADPCCNHSGDHKMSDRNCAQTCATTCAVGAAPPLSPTAATFVVAIARLTPAALNFVRAYQPSGLKRPPKSIV